MFKCYSGLITWLNFLGNAIMVFDQKNIKQITGFVSIRWH